MDSDTANFRKSSMSSSFDPSLLSLGGQPSRVKRITLAMTGSLADSLAIVPGSVGSSCRLTVLMIQTVSTSALSSSSSNLASGPTGRRLRASALLWSYVFLYSMVYWYWLSVRAHRASLLAAKAGVALVGRNITRRGLWSVTGINVRP